MPPAPVVGLKPMRIDFLQCGIVGRLLDFAHALARPGVAADQMQRTPCQQRGDRAEVGRIGRAANPRRLEGDRAATAHRIAHTRNMTEATRAQLLHQFRQCRCRGSQMGVDFFPGFAGGTGYLLGAQAVVELLVVVEAIEGQALNEVFLISGETRTPARFGVAVLHRATKC
jgi:hypothetical protein